MGSYQHRYDSLDNASSTDLSSSDGRQKILADAMDIDRIRASNRRTHLIVGGMYLISLAAIFAFFSAENPSSNGSLYDWKTSQSNESDSVPRTPPSIHIESDSMSNCPDVDPIELLKSSSVAENVENGAVAADDARCSEIGLSILRDLGGNAIDAAVATSLCLSVVNPSASGLGGGAFILTHTDSDPDRESEDFNDRREKAYPEDFDGKVTEFIDCREVAPKGATWDMFEEDNDASWNGGKAIAVPGLLKGLALMHSRHGRLGFAKLVEPAEKLAREGVVVDGYLSHAINIKSSKAKIFRHEHIAKLLTKNHDGKTLLQEGDILTNPALANTFRKIMEEGPDVLYSGELGDMIAKDIQDKDGIITAEDMSSYEANMYDPLVTKPGEVKGFTMVGAPPPSSGGSVVIGAARFLSGYKEPFSTFDDTLSVHRMVEALKHAYSVRMSLSDPEFYPAQDAAAVKDLMTGDFMEKMRNLTLDDDTLPMNLYGGDKWGFLTDADLAEGKAEVTEEGHDNRRLRGEQSSNKKRRLRGWQYLNDHGTTHISIVDKDGNAVTMTATINTYFGSGIVSPSTGIIFNSQMDDFSSPGAPNHYGVAPSESNYIQPGKKPLSSISPTLVFKPERDSVDEYHLGRLALVFGASGGPKIPSATLQVFVHHILEGMPLWESIIAPRVHDQLLFKGHSTTLYDHAELLQGPMISLPNRTKDALKRRNHNLAPVPNTGTSQAVSIDLETGLMTAVSDPRKGGKAFGY